MRSRKNFVTQLRFLSNPRTFSLPRNLLNTTLISPKYGFFLNQTFKVRHRFLVRWKSLQDRSNRKLLHRKIRFNLIRRLKKSKTLKKHFKFFLQNHKPVTIKHSKKIKLNLKSDENTKK